VVESLIIGLIVFLLFGANRLPDIGRAIGNGFGGLEPPTSPPPLAPSGEQVERRCRSATPTDS
jgi:TatA/E family protein of Tat protein translocase